MPQRPLEQPVFQDPRALPGQGVSAGPRVERLGGGVVEAHLHRLPHPLHRRPLLGRAPFAPLHDRLHPRRLLLPARDAGEARLPDRDVQRRRHRLGQRHAVARPLVPPALALSRKRRSRTARSSAPPPGASASSARAGRSWRRSSRSATTRPSAAASRASTWPAGDAAASASSTPPSIPTTCCASSSRRCGASPGSSAPCW